jgi:Ca2+-transporting ATPase
MFSAITVPPLVIALEIAPIGIDGWALAVGCSLLPLVGGQLWLLGKAAN